MKFLDAFKHWKTYFFALVIEFVTTRAEMFFCLRRKDYGCILGNLMLVAWWILAVSVIWYFYERRKGVKQ
jgi:hypothetical protein